jgi:hypothetical protein
VALWLQARILGAEHSRALVVAGIVVAAGVIIRHRPNIERLINGTENRFSRGAGRDGKGARSESAPEKDPPEGGDE